MSTESKISLKDQSATQNEGRALRINSAEDHTDTNDSENKKPQCKETGIQIEPSQNLETGRAVATYPVKTPTTWVYLGYENNPGVRDPMEDSDRLDYTPDRNQFVSRVFTIVFVMLVVTAASTGFIVNIEELEEIFIEFQVILGAASVGILLGVGYAMSCCPCARILPCSIVCLLLSIVGMTIICSVLCMRYPADLIIIAMASTAGVVLVCILLAMSSFDFTSLLLYVVVISAAVAIGSLAAFIYMMITGVYITWLHLGILLVGLIMNVVILTIELQMILGGKAVEIGVEDYAYGAYLLYVSIIDIFMKLVHILGIFGDM